VAVEAVVPVVVAVVAPVVPVVVAMAQAAMPGAVTAKAVLAPASEAPAVRSRKRVEVGAEEPVRMAPEGLGETMVPGAGEKVTARAPERSGPTKTGRTASVR
jgi:hypothetical protein